VEVFEPVSTWTSPLIEVEVKVTLRTMVSQPVCLGVKPHQGPKTIELLCSLYIYTLGTEPVENTASDSSVFIVASRVHCRRNVFSLPLPSSRWLLLLTVSSLCHNILIDISLVHNIGHSDLQILAPEILIWWLTRKIRHISKAWKHKLHCSVMFLMLQPIWSKILVK
jgi:hypothetical protein